MTFSPVHATRRYAPHNVAPKTHSLRDWVSFPPSDALVDDSTTTHHYGAIDDDDDIIEGAFDTSTTNHLPRDIASSLDDTAAAAAETITTKTRCPIRHCRSSHLLRTEWECIESFATRIPAVCLVALFHLMIGIPFGVSYFPIGWRSSPLSGESSSDGGGGRGGGWGRRYGQ